SAPRSRVKPLSSFLVASFGGALPARHRLRRQRFRIDCARQVTEPISLRITRSRLISLVPLQSIFGRARIIRIMLRRRIGIGAHPMEGHVGNGKRSGLVEVHVFDKSICIEEVITLPSRKKGRQRRGAELRVNVLSRSEDSKAIVSVLQKHGDIAVTCVASALASEGPSVTGALVVIGEIAGSFTVHL